jgi:hypothetical protein
MRRFYKLTGGWVDIRRDKPIDWLTGCRFVNAQH